MAKQIGTMESVNKSWSDGVTKAIDFINQDVRERGLITARLSDKLMKEVNAQVRKCVVGS